MIRRWYILLLSALLLVVASGCSDKGRVIPEDDFKDLLIEMFIADQWLRENGDARDRADTTLFFEPILNKHGYSFKDYDASLYYYAGEINRFSEITYEAVGKLEELKNRYEKLVDMKAEVTRKNEQMMLDYEDRQFYSDSSELILPGSLWPEAAQIDTLPIVLVSREIDTLEFSPKDRAVLGSKMKVLELSSIDKKVINK